MRTRPDRAVLIASGRRNNWPFRRRQVRFRMGWSTLGVAVGLVLTIATGRIEPERAEAFQVKFRTSLMRRFKQAPFLRQAMLADLGEGVWQMQTLWDSTLAQNHPVDNAVPLTVRIFREFGAEPEIQLADVSSFLQPTAERPTLAQDATIAQRLDSTAAREATDE
jgi:hypothetical protein